MFAEEAVPERDGMTAFACLIDCKTIEKICGSWFYKTFLNVKAILIGGIRYIYYWEHKCWLSFRGNFGNIWFDPSSDVCEDRFHSLVPVFSGLFLELCEFHQFNIRSTQASKIRRNETFTRANFTEVKFPAIPAMDTLIFGKLTSMESSKAFSRKSRATMIIGKENIHPPRFKRGREDLMTFNAAMDNTPVSME